MIGGQVFLPSSFIPRRTGFEEPFSGAGKNARLGQRDRKAFTVNWTLFFLRVHISRTRYSSLSKPREIRSETIKSWDLGDLLM